MLSFLVALSPRGLWHSHEHDEETIAHSVSLETSIDVDCFACDFDLGVYTSANSYFYQFPEKDNFVEKKQILVQADKAFFQTNLLRGPPSFI